jgi:DNA-binding transcriptional LysR family regulator
MRTLYDVFLQIVESGSITKACAALNISQPGLSKQIRRLEDELKVELFERSPNGIKLTKYGEALVAPARAMRAADHSARMTIERLRQSVLGHAVFGATPPLAMQLMPQVTLDLLETSPGLQLTIVEEQPDVLIDMVRRKEIEFAICAGGERSMSEELTARPLFEDTRIIVASAAHEIFKAMPLDIAALLDASWVLPRSVISSWLGERFRSLGMAPPLIRVETSSIVQTINLVESGKFISSMPSSTVRQQLADKTILPVLPELFSSKIFFKAIYRQDSQLSFGAKLVVDGTALAGRTHLHRSEDVSIVAVQ